MGESKQIIFYDAPSCPPVKGWMPNPWKTRYALNFKKLPFTTEWVDFLDIASVRRDRLGLSPDKYRPDGSPSWTLPMLQDPTTGTVLGDSFDIAVYLDAQYPDSGPSPLFTTPRGHTGLARAFNAYVDATFYPAMLLFPHGLPLDPATADKARAELVRRMGAKSWDDVTVRGEERTRTLEGLKERLGGLAKAFRRRDEGPFLEGKEASYADFVVGGWLMYVVIAVKEWEDVRTWHDGLWGKLHEALQQYNDLK